MTQRTDNRTSPQVEMWAYDPKFAALVDDSRGYEVEVLDGYIGTVEEVSNEAGRSSLIIDTGRWMSGTKRMVPASYVTNVDPNEQKVFVGMTKAQIKDAPDYDEMRRADTAYLDDSEHYYGALRTALQ